MNAITLREAQFQDLPEIQKLFVDTIRHICKADYSPKQLEAWASGIENKERWQDRMHSQWVLVAKYETQIVGFCSLDKGNYVDLFYVHKDFQRMGVAKILFSAILEEVQVKELTADVSITARPFFEKMGFEVITEQSVSVKNVYLTNYRMVRKMG